MLIQCPLNQKTLDFLDEYIEAGADEFYLGYRNELTGHHDYLNRRLGAFCNFNSLDSALAAVSRIKKTGKKAYVVLNELYYPEAWHATLLEEVKRFRDAGFDGIIVSDLNLLVMINEIRCDFSISLSSTTHVLNMEAVRFFKQFGMDRCILPRQLSVSEICAILDTENSIRFEIMIMNEECPNLEGYCSYAHLDGNDYFNICRQILMYNSIDVGVGFVADSCGACSVYSFKDYPDLVFKIVGRSIPFDWIKSNIQLLKKAIWFSGQCESSHEFALFCAEEHARIFKERCKKKCYYALDFAPADDVTGDNAPSSVKAGCVKYLASPAYRL